MEKVSINNSGLNVFQRIQTSKENKKTSTHHNPFGISFKGSVLQADVFESNKPSIDSKEQMTNKGKLFTSAIVGSINNFNNSFRRRLDAVVSFGQKTKEKVGEFWKKANETEFKMSDLISSFQGLLPQKRVSPEVIALMDKPVSELGDMLRSSIAAEAA